MSDLAPGVAHALARERAARIRALEADVRLRIPADRQTPISGDVTLRFDLTDPSHPLALDFAPAHGHTPPSVSVNGSQTDAACVNGHLHLPAEVLRSGTNTVHVAFVAGDVPLNRRDDHLYSIFVPARAHEALPCFDQPDLKARWQLELDLPPGWTGLSNTRPESVVHADAPDGSRRPVVRFARTHPLPTYLFAFAAGHFTRTIASTNPRDIHVYVTTADRARLVPNLQTIVDAHSDALRWMEDFTAVPHPFATLDVVLLPAFQFTGMEHPGAIFYAASALLLDNTATRQQQLARAHVIAHETAHLWFGDLVTMRWFDDVWMKEVFANMMAARIMEPAVADLDQDLRFFHAHYPGAYDVDRTAGTHPIRQVLDNLSDAGSLYGPIIYLKSPIVFRHLERAMGSGALQAALREYLDTFRFGNASWPDLLTILARHTSLDLAAWSRDWVDSAGRPALHVSHTSGSIAVHCDAPRTPGVVAAGRWAQPVSVSTLHGRDERREARWLDGTTVLNTDLESGAVDAVLPTGDGLAYGDCRLDEGSARFLLTHVDQLVRPTTRAAAWVALWDSMLAGRVTAEALFEAAVAMVRDETSELNLQRVLSDLESLAWTHLEPAAFARLAPALEVALQARLERAGRAPERSAVFASLRAVTSSDEGCAWLYDVWLGHASLAGGPLTTQEQALLTRDLAVRRSDADAVVRTQVERMPEGEARDALVFVADALSADPAVRQQFFARLTDAAHRRREPWVVDGLRWLHHPLRAEASAPLIAPALDMLEEVKRTGDIFLPQRWAAAVLRGHRSPAAAAIVGRFLDTRPPGYSPALRRVVLWAGSHLLRIHAW